METSRLDCFQHYPFLFEDQCPEVATVRCIVGGPAKNRLRGCRTNTDGRSNSITGLPEETQFTTIRRLVADVFIYTNFPYGPGYTGKHHTVRSQDTLNDSTEGLLLQDYIPADKLAKQFRPQLDII